jgi:hypothetical protein
MTRRQSPRVHPARKAQGFRSQAHLDACGLPAPGYETTDGGYQPAETICPEGRRLLDLSC